MKILITGATGFIGSSLGEYLAKEGHAVVLVTRNAKEASRHLTYKADLVECDLNSEALPLESFAKINVVINLAGESIEGRWTRAKKSKILNSRIYTSRNLLKNCPDTVSTIITASAQGIYGDRGDELISESSSLGTGFLADVCRSWEAEFKNRNQRVVVLRFGLVMSPAGGALQKLIMLFKKNLGAPLGSGLQWVSYISLNDLVRLISEAVKNPRYDGVINAVNNSPVTNAELTTELCKKLKVWCLPYVPAKIIRIMLGEMSELVLSSLRLKPQKLNQLGFIFKDADLNAILNSIEA